MAGVTKKERDQRWRHLQRMRKRPTSGPAPDFSRFPTLKKTFDMPRALRKLFT